jgi:glycosyltransferase involved in cell wall biosynthesis
VKVFLASTSLLPAYGGPAYSVSRLARALANAGVDVGLWAADQSSAATPLLAGEGAPRRLFGNVAEAMAAFGRAQVIHDNGIWLRHNHGLARAAREQRAPRLVSTRGMLEPWARRHKHWKKGLAWYAYQRRDLRAASLMHATSAEEEANILELGLGVPTRVIPNGIDIPEESPSPARASKSEGSPRTALFLGRIYPVKGLPMLVEAWGRVRPSGWRLVIAGPDEAGHKAHVERAVVDARLQQAVSFAGPVEGAAKRRLFEEAQLFVLPSHSESFGMAIAEALAHGLPVLTTTAAPWPALAECECGWRVEPTVDGIAGGLAQSTALGPATLRAMGAAGRQHVATQYSWDDVARRFINLYEELA